MPAYPAVDHAWGDESAEMAGAAYAGDGERIDLRPVRPEDADALQEFFRSLSDDARRSRFFRAVRELSPSLIHDFTHVDHHARSALIMTARVGGVDAIVGDARYVVVEPGAAEFAIAVADDWRRRGLGRLLLSRLLCRAAREGVSRLFGDVLTANESMQRLARGFGFTFGPALAGGLVRLELRLNGGRGADCVRGGVPQARLAA